MTKKIENMIALELDAACDVHGQKFNSMAEGWAVLKEEVEEAQDEMDQIKTRADCMWYNVKSNKPMFFEVNNKVIYTKAIKAIKELIQVAAMAKKNLRSFDKKKEGV